MITINYDPTIYEERRKHAWRCIVCDKQSTRLRYLNRHGGVVREPITERGYSNKRVVICANCEEAKRGTAD